MIDVASEPIYSLDAKQVAERFQVDLSEGLSDEEAGARLKRCGRNQLSSRSQRTCFRLLISQLSNTMSVVLVVAGILAFLVRDYPGGVVIAIVIVINTVVGFIQEYKAETTIRSLRKMSFPTCSVIRGGDQKTIPTGDLVPGL
jgi:P-type Na+/K+ transporter